MGKQHLPEHLPGLFAIGKERSTHIPKCQPLQLLHPVIFHFQGYQCREGLHHMVTCLLRPAVAVPGRACARIGSSPCSDNHRPAVILAAISHPDALDTSFALGPLLQQKPRHPGIGHQPDAQLMQPHHHGIHHVGSPVADRKNPAAPLHLHRHAQPLKKKLHILIVIGLQAAVQKLAVAGNILNQLLLFRHIGNIAAPLAGNQHLLASSGHLLQKGNRCTVFRCLDSRHHTGRACPYHNYGIRIFHIICTIYAIHIIHIIHAIHQATTPCAHFQPVSLPLFLLFSSDGQLPHL